MSLAMDSPQRKIPNKRRQGDLAVGEGGCRSGKKGADCPTSAAQKRGGILGKFTVVSHVFRGQKL